MAVTLLACGMSYSAGTLAQTQAPLRPPGSGTAVTQPPLLSGGASIDLAVPLYQSRVVTVITPANRVSVANPDVADIVVISPTELYVLGKDLGTTNVLLWDRSSHLIGAINVEVQHDLDSLKRKFAELLPGQSIEVRASQRSIVLSGRVSDAEAMNAATRIAVELAGSCYAAAGLAPLAAAYSLRKNSRILAASKVSRVPPDSKCSVNTRPSAYVAAADKAGMVTKPSSPPIPGMLRRSGPW